MRVFVWGYLKHRENSQYLKYKFQTKITARKNKRLHTPQKFGNVLNVHQYLGKDHKK